MQFKKLWLNHTAEDKKTNNQHNIKALIKYQILKIQHFKHLYKFSEDT